MAASETEISRVVLVFVRRTLPSRPSWPWMVIAPADKLGDGCAQLVSDERLERCLGRGHVLSLRRVVYTGARDRAAQASHQDGSARARACCSKG